LGELDATTEAVTQHLEAYDVAPAAAALERFVDGLSNWYTRRSRRRFWKAADDADKRDAEETLYHVLVELSKLLAPFTPFTAEAMYRNLTSGESVHLEDWPKPSRRKVDRALLTEMDLARTVVTLALRARQDAKVRVRQPLAKLSVAARELSAEIEELVRDEVNVKEIEYVSDPEQLGTAERKLNFAVAGKKYGSEVKQIQKELAAGTLTRKLDSEDVLTTYRGKEGTAVAGTRSTGLARRGGHS
jgi:isoleucyl-tRNA synthetase